MKIGGISIYDIRAKHNTFVGNPNYKKVGVRAKNGYAFAWLRKFVSENNNPAINRMIRRGTAILESEQGDVRSLSSESFLIWPNRL